MFSKILKGYKIELIDIDGDHRNDAQLVDYTFLFTNEKLIIFVV